MLGHNYFKGCSTGVDFELWTCKLLGYLRFDAKRVGHNDGGICVTSMTGIIA